MRFLPRLHLRHEEYLSEQELSQRILFLYRASASITSPLAARFGFAFNSITSAVRRTISSSSWIPSSCMCGYRNENRYFRPSLPESVHILSVLVSTFDICARFIDLIDCNDNFNSGSFCMIDCFYCLRHYSVVCRYDKDGDIRGACSAHTHIAVNASCPGVIEERKIFSPFDFHNLCSDMLCDTACFTVDHIWSDGSHPEEMFYHGRRAPSHRRPEDVSPSPLHLPLPLFNSSSITSTTSSFHRGYQIPLRSLLRYHNRFPDLLLRLFLHEQFFTITEGTIFILSASSLIVSTSGSRSV